MAASAVAQQAALQCSALQSIDSAARSSKRTVVCQLQGHRSQRAGVRSHLQKSKSPLIRSTFVSGAPLVSPSALTRTVSAPTRRSVRCMAEPDAQSTNASGADVWLGRAAMLAFTAVLTTEIVAGKGVFALAGLETPSPGLAIAVAIVLGGGAAFSVLKSLFK
ncbi:stress enhanced protein, SEP1, lil4 [Klebsormidium nitens]|uniref:Stress enhanced protein, SEP1, lil4 n=1 Tax=Klebsormidium nitens TaxID=105231 RepID=A0A1Y1IL40_KLENI|nr:stress enhanced protein, SEP1, lil4 [Klebsormidium nitens]|eukprot:GAQ91580.1 stress enhanced protein, SEP1, lil4 [Klebsormidium nitens]